ncbi:MAG: alpha/beta hydrolase [Spirochaetaceae bacterium]|nr:alpha/beta hydrolase [Spirochaetaceae bacterium]
MGVKPLLFRYTESPSRNSILWEKVLWTVKVKESQNSDFRKSQRVFNVGDFSKSITSPSPPEHLLLGIKVEQYQLTGRNIFILSPRKPLQVDLDGLPRLKAVAKRRRAPESPKRVLFLHGGSYVVNATIQHWAFLSHIIEATGCTVIAPDYPLAPEANYSSAYNLLRQLYMDLVKQVKPSDLTLMGDSAGGGLCLGFAQLIRNEGLPSPSNVIMLSPWLDVTLSNPAIQAIDPEDPFLNLEALRDAGRAWAGGANPRKPLISPLYGKFTGLPPLHLFIGTKDIMMADCKRLADRCHELNVKFGDYVFENMLHDWALFDFKEAKSAQKQIASIIRGDFTL